MINRILKFDPTNSLAHMSLSEGKSLRDVVYVFPDEQNKELLIEKNGESVLIRETDIEQLISDLEKARELLR